MNKSDQFETGITDSQATPVVPLNPDNFDVSAYEAYEQQLLEKCQNFRESESGVLVYRRMRVAEVFSHGSKDMKKSLEWQLGALAESMRYKADQRIKDGRCRFFKGHRS